MIADVMETARKTGQIYQQKLYIKADFGSVQAEKAADSI